MLLLLVHNMRRLLREPIVGHHIVVDGLLDSEFATGLVWQAIGEDVFLRRVRSRRRCDLAQLGILLLMLLPRGRRLLRRLLLLLLLCKPLGSMEGLKIVLLAGIDDIRLCGGAAR